MSHFLLPVHVEIAQWWYDIRKPLIQLKLDLGLRVNVSREKRILKEATTITFGKVKI